MYFKRSYKVVLIFLISAIVFFVFRRDLFSKVVEVRYPERGSAVEAIYATGSVEGTTMLPLAPRTTSRILSFAVDEGSSFRKGAVLARFEDEDLRRKVEELEVREKNAQVEADRTFALYASKAISNKELEKFRTEWLAAQAATNAAREQIKFLQLSAPFDGMVVRRDGEVGETIPANQAVLWIVTHEPLRIAVEVDEEDISKVKPGQKVLIKADGFPGTTFNGLVSSITPKGDPLARSFRVRINFTSVTPLMIGMTAETNIIVKETANALLIPQSAIKEGKVFVVDNNKLLLRDLDLGTCGNEKCEVLKGLRDDELVMSEANPAFSAGQRVRAHVSQRE